MVIFENEPALEFLCLQSKYGPFRDELMRAASEWSKVAYRSTTCRSKVFCRKQVCGGRRSMVGGLSRTLHLWAILRDALRASSKYDGKWDVWVTNCGRNVSHRSGLVPMCQRLHIIELTPNSNVNGFFLSSAERNYVFLDSAAEKATSLAKLGQVIQFMDALSLADVRGPRSCSE